MVRTATRWLASTSTPSTTRRSAHCASCISMDGATGSSRIRPRCRYSHRTSPQVQKSHSRIERAHAAPSNGLLSADDPDGFTSTSRGTCSPRGRRASRCTRACRKRRRRPEAPDCQAHRYKGRSNGSGSSHRTAPRPCRHRLEDGAPAQSAWTRAREVAGCAPPYRDDQLHKPGSQRPPQAQWSLAH
jgi:hypothetical protein